VDGGEAGVDIREINAKVQVVQSLPSKQDTHQHFLQTSSNIRLKETLQDILFALARCNIFVAWLVPRWFPLHRERRSVPAPSSPCLSFCLISYDRLQWLP
jgi:hypothetical protein